MDIYIPRFYKYTVFHTIIPVLLLLSSAWAGPPFKTDDPQPVDYLHWEFYIASSQQFMRHESDATCPHIEINYGLISNVQVHIVAPLGYVHTDEGTHYGYSDTEIGVKYRFIEESESVPQIAIFPLIEIPTGNENEQLGNGKTQAYIPLWIQKSWGKLTAYGGGGIWYNPGPDRKNWMFTGSEIQYDFSDIITLGCELCYQTAEIQDAESTVSFTFGGFVNLNERHHILFSLGHTLSGQTIYTGYIGYQLTI
jgi:hypothetical protein